MNECTYCQGRGWIWVQLHDGEVCKEDCCCQENVEIVG